MTSFLRAIDAQCERNPHQIAIRWRDTSVRYDELRAQVHAYAAVVRSHALPPESPVAICAERSPRWVACALGVLRAGAAYLPLDVESPVARNRSILQRAGVRLAFSDGARRPRIEGLVPKLITLTAVDPEQSFVELCTPHPEALAYVLHTSGSTGLPKAVGIPHRALQAHLAWRERRFPMSESDRFIQKANPVFDISVWEMLAPLTVGATVVMADEGGHRDPRYLRQLMAEEAATHAHFHPRLLGAWLDVEDELDEAIGRHLSRVFVGGESLTGALARRFVTRFPHTQLIHQYGPTETTIDISAWEVSSDAPAGDDGDALPLGTVVDGSRLMLLDEALEPTGRGELAVSGASVARGYLGDPRATAERFVPDPSGPAGARLYLTGDRASEREGALTFIGRRDRQVKLRGYRMELGEIETTALACPGAAQAYACLVRSGSAATRLVLFVAQKASGPSEPSLRTFLTQRLVEYMVPTQLVLLTELPTLASGKPDGQALRELAKIQWERGTDVAVEEKLAMYVERIRETTGSSAGPDDDFFAVGGDSVLALALLMNLEAELRVSIDLASFFETPTARGLLAATQSATEGLSDEGLAVLPEHQLDALLLRLQMEANP